MGEFAPVTGLGNAAARPAPEPERPAIAAIAGSAGGGAVSGRMDRPASGAGHGGTGRRSEGDDAPAMPERRRLEADVLTGPPPSFQASLLELESDIRHAIARVEAARGRRESEVAMGEARRAESAPAPDAGRTPPAEAGQADSRPATEPAADAEMQARARPEPAVAEAAPEAPEAENTDG